MCDRDYIAGEAQMHRKFAMRYRLNYALKRILESILCSCTFFDIHFHVLLYFIREIVIQVECDLYVTLYHVI